MPRRRRAHKAPLPLREVNQTPGASKENPAPTLKPQGDTKILALSIENFKLTEKNDENCRPTVSHERTNTDTPDLCNELDSFRQRWKRELDVTKPQDEKTLDDIGQIKSILDDDDVSQLASDKISTNTADLYNELDSFRQRWRRELEGTKPQVRSPSDIYAEAKKLFLIAVELEQDDMHHESIRFYKMAMHLCPDIEKQIFREQCAASAIAAANTTAAASPNLVDQGSNQSSGQENMVSDGSEKVQLYNRIYQNLQEDMTEEPTQVNCRPKNKLKPGTLHISDLPHELILQIFRYVIGEELDLASLESLGLVCRGFYLLSNDLSLWRSICYHTWGEDIKIHVDHKKWHCEDGKNFVQINWKQMFLDRPRVNFDGVYISRTRYIRQGDVGFQDVTYRPFHVIRYYRYLRFFPDKRVLILTTNEEPDKIIPIFRSALHSKQFSPELSILEGTYEFSSAKQINIVAEKDCRSALNLSQNFRRKVQQDWLRQTPISQKFNLKFELKTVESKPYKNNVLKWLDYTLLTRLETGQDITTFDLSPETFPNLIFSRVKKFNLRLTNPLSSH